MATPRKKAALKPEVNEGEVLASAIKYCPTIPTIKEQQYYAEFYNNDGELLDGEDYGEGIEHAKSSVRKWLEETSSSVTRAILYVKKPVLTIINDL